MSRRRSQSELSVSLFPFLAVLVCAMGALILLLLIITKQVRSQAMSPPVVDEIEVVASALLPSLQPAAQIEISENHASALINQTTLQRPVTDAVVFDEQKDGDNSRKRLLEKQKEELQSSRLQQKLIQMQIADLSSRLAKEKERVKSLQAKYQKLSREKTELEKTIPIPSDSPKQAGERLRKLQAELLQKKRELEKQKQIASEITGKLEIVTYDGSTGIRRKPIFIEAVAGSIIFQPEQVKITSRELEQFSPETHPLGFAVRALNDFRNKKEASQESAYVLLVVRPDGIDEFYAARRILGAQGITFGYELVGADQELYFAQQDTRAKKVIEEALAHSRQSAIQKQTGGFHLAGNGHSPFGAQRPQLDRGGLERKPGFLPQRTGKNNSFKKGSDRPPRETTGDRFEKSMHRAGVSGLNRNRPSVDKGIAKNGKRDSATRQLPSGRGKWDTTQSHSHPSSDQSASGQFASEEELKQMLSAEKGLGNPTIFPQLNSLSSRAKHLNRGTPDALISFEKKLSVIVTAKSLQVGAQDPVSISELESDTEIVRKFLHALEREMAQWPAPPKGFRWVPGFQLKVSPGGNQTAFRIEAVAKELKLRVKTEFIMGDENKLFK